MNKEDIKKLLSCLYEHYISNYENGIIKCMRINLCLDVYRVFSSSTTNAIKSLLNNEYGLLGNLMYKFVKEPNDEVMSFMKEKDKKVILDCYKQYGKRMIDNNYLSGLLDEMVWLIQYDEKCFQEIDPSLKKSVRFYAEIAKINPNLLHSLKFKSTKIELENSLLYHPDLFRYLPIEYKRDRDLVLKLVQKDGIQLIYAYEFQDDYEIVHKAVLNNGMALSAVHSMFKDDEELVKIAVNQSSWALQYASERLRDDEYLVMLAVMGNGSTIQYASERLKDNKNIALKAVENNPFAFRFLSERLRGDYDISSIALSKEKSMYKYLSTSIEELKRG